MDILFVRKRQILKCNWWYFLFIRKRQILFCNWWETLFGKILSGLVINRLAIVLGRLAGRKPNGSSRPVSPRQREFNIGAHHQGNKARRAWRGLEAARLAAVTQAHLLWLSLRENPRQSWVHREPTVQRCHERHVDNKPQGGTCISGNGVCLETQRRSPPSMRDMSLPSALSKLKQA